MDLHLSEASQSVIIAFNKGYRVRNGLVISPYRASPIKPMLSSAGYEIFSVSTHFKHRMKRVPIHRLVAYEKYGGECFKPGIQVRHLNDIKRDNSWGNIMLGTQCDNMMDKPKELRVWCAANAARSAKRFTDAKIEKIRAYYSSCRSYKRTMKRFKISSKGSLHYMLNHEYVQL